MPWDEFYSEYNSRLVNEYPAISALSEPWQNRNVISPYKIFLPQSVIDSITEAVDNIFRLSRQDSYREAVLSAPGAREIISSSAANLSVLMSYDFHLDGDTPRLLEINTNASGYLIANAIYNMHAQSNPFPQAINSLKKSFIEEFQRLGLEGSPHIAIIDEAPRAQKMFPLKVMKPRLTGSTIFAPMPMGVRYKCSLHAFTRDRSPTLTRPMAATAPFSSANWKGNDRGMGGWQDGERRAPGRGDVESLLKNYKHRMSNIEF